MCTQTSDQFEDVRFDIPTTEEEAFRILDEVYPLEGKKIALDETKDEFIINEHFGLGMWIRNNWIYLPDDVDPVTSDRHKKCYVMLSGEPGSNCQCWHADELSGDFLGKYYDHLKATYCDEPFSNETK